MQQGLQTSHTCRHLSVLLHACVFPGSTPSGGTQGRNPGGILASLLPPPLPIAPHIQNVPQGRFKPTHVTSRPRPPPSPSRHTIISAWTTATASSPLSLPSLLAFQTHPPPSSSCEHINRAAPFPCCGPSVPVHCLGLSGLLPCTRPCIFHPELCGRYLGSSNTSTFILSQGLCTGSFFSLECPCRAGAWLLLPALETRFKCHLLEDAETLPSHLFGQYRPFPSYCLWVPHHLWGITPHFGDRAYPLYGASSCFSD